MATNPSTVRIVRQSELPALSLSLTDATSGAYNTEPVIVAETGQFGIFRYVDGYPYSVYLVPTQQVFAQHAGAAVATSTATTSLLDAASSSTGTLTIAANRLIVGQSLHIIAAGIVSTKTGTEGTGTVTLNVGGVALASNSGVCGAVAMTNAEWYMEFLATVRAVGASGRLFGQGWLHVFNAGTATPYPLKMTAQSSAIDFTADAAIDITWKWDISDAANSALCTNAIVRLLGISV